MDQVVLHYIVADPVGKIQTTPLVADNGKQFSEGGNYLIACDPGRSSLSAKFRATGEAWLVNCPRCRKTKYYEAADKSTPDTRMDMVPEAVLRELNSQ